MKCKECEARGIGMVAGQAFTKYVCKKCGQIAWYHNTATPNYCVNCCEEDYICEYCGKSLLIEAIIDNQEKTSLYNVALEIGVSETSLRNYITKGKIGDRVLKKVKEWYKNNYERRF